MDMLKILTRSTKHSKATIHSTNSVLPSSGQDVNPQLYPSTAPEQTSTAQPKKKRKSRHDDLDDLPSELNFFAQPQKNTTEETNGDSPAGKTSKKRKRSSVAGAANETSREHTNPTGTSSELLDEDDCKRELRAHKVKIVVLEDHRVLESSSEKKSRKKKKKKVEEEEPKVSKKKSEIVIQPLRSFSQLHFLHGVSKRIMENIEAQGYKTPTEVQLAALPLLLEAKDAIKEQRKSWGKEELLSSTPDLLSVAPTGSGKTLAFLIPTMNAILKYMSTESEQETPQETHPRAIVIAPTKELAAQIVNEGRKLAQGTKIRLALMRKGMEIVERGEIQAPDVDDEENFSSEEDSDDEDDEEQPTKPTTKQKSRSQVTKADILACTPLALVHALTLTDQTTAPLPGVRHLILDEADVLLDSLFLAQTLTIWTACTNPHLRLSLWSATLPSSTESLLLRTLTTRWNTLPSSSSLPPRPPLLRLIIGLKDSALPSISHRLIYAASEPGKLLATRALLRPTSGTPSPLRPPFLIFTQSVPRALALHAELAYDIPPSAGGSARIAVLHAQLSDARRADTLARFRRGEVWVLVTTDLLARGLDFRGLNGVLNYDAPTSAAGYVHRVGRTGRGGRTGGVAVTLWGREDVRHIRGIANVIAAAEKGKDDAGKGVEGVEGAGGREWMLDGLPRVGKRERQKLKRRGVEERRPGAKGKGVGRISTKVEGGRKWKGKGKGEKKSGEKKGRGKESEFEGFSG